LRLSSHFQLLQTAPKTRGQTGALFGSARQCTYQPDQRITRLGPRQEIWIRAGGPLGDGFCPRKATETPETSPEMSFWCGTNVFWWYVKIHVSPDLTKVGSHFWQWEFQDPKIEVLCHIKPYFGGSIPIRSPYIDLI
jgi:hypothetical protein